MLKYLIVVVYSLLFQPAPANADDVDIPNTFSDGTPAVAAEVNENFEALKAAIEQLSAQLDLNSLGMTPVGGIVMFYGETADIPQRWQLCDGQQILDPESPLHLSNTPNMVNRFARGIGSQGTLEAGGADAHEHALSIGRDSVVSPRQVYVDVGIPNAGPDGISSRFFPLSWDIQEGGSVYNSHGHVGTAIPRVHIPAHVSVRFIMRIK